MSKDITDPAAYWPGEAGYRVSSDDAMTLTNSLLAIAAELRTGNLIAFNQANAAGAFAANTSTSYRELRARLGLAK